MLLKLRYPLAAANPYYDFLSSFFLFFFKHELVLQTYELTHQGVELSSWRDSG